MGINVAGTNAIGDYLVSKIKNARTLIGAAPQAAPLPATSTAAGVRAQLQAQNLANTRLLFGVPAANDTGANALPPIAGQTAHQIAFAAIQSANISSTFSNIATLFGIGAKTNPNA